MNNMDKNSIEVLFALDDNFYLVQSYYDNVKTPSEYADLMYLFYEDFINSNFNQPWRPLTDCIKEFYEDLAEHWEWSLQQQAEMDKYEAEAAQGYLEF